MKRRTGTSSRQGTTPEANGPAVRVTGLTKVFRRADGTDVRAIDDISFVVEPGQMVVLLGPSGCGKTTLLRTIAGLEYPDDGEIAIRERVVFSGPDSVNVPTERRRLSMIFQSYALWPHMSVVDNIAYPLRSTRPKPSKSEIDSRVARVMDFVGDANLGGQYPAQLSGGQQQRVALARALVSNDDVILFDEPLSNVDAKVRERLRNEIYTMQRELGFAAVYVTHDQSEAMGLADRIAVLEDGRIAQFASPLEIYREPVSRTVANFVGVSNEIPGTLIHCGADGVGRVDTQFGQISGTLSSVDLAIGDTVVLSFRPELVRLVDASESALEATVEHVLFLGPHTEVRLRCSGTEFRVTAPGISTSAVRVGDAVGLDISTSATRILAE